MQNEKLCPCSSGRSYGECCRDIVNGTRPAATAEELMRARYTAYAVGNVDFLFRSSGAQVRTEFDEKSTREWSQTAKWSGLEILSTEKGGADDEEGVVEFIAHYSAKGQNCAHHERAIFQKVDGEWRFIDGTVQNGTPTETVHRTEPKIGRNDPCPCGSGKKYKKCCGKGA